jgi:hypothetical protein
MQFALAILRRDFDTGDNLDAGAGCCLTRSRHATERIMIGHRQRGQTGTASEIDNLRRRIRSVAMRSVDVQIDALGVLAACSELTKCSKRLTGGHFHVGEEGG